MLSGLERADAAATVDPRHLRALGFDLLGRPPLPAERERWKERPFAELVADLLAGEDGWRHWLDEQLYYLLLVNNFAPRTESVQALPRELAAGTVDVRAALHRIALTPTFDARNPGADTFVTVVMEQLAGLDVKRNARDLEAGKRIYDGAQATYLGAKGDSQSDVVSITMASKQFSRHLLAREHLRLTREEAPAKELATWCAAFDASPASYASIVEEWLASDAYRRRLAVRHPLSNRAFVRALFVDLVGRVPTAKEAEPMREALDALSDPTPLRAFLARTLVESSRVKLPERKDVGDSREWIRGRFEQLLARAPSEAELAVFAGALEASDGRPRTLLTALVTSPEYQEV